MSMLRRFFVALILLYPSLAFCQFSESSHYLDSVSHRALQGDPLSLSCYFSYPQGSNLILGSFAGNASELEELDLFIRAALAGRLVKVRKITLTGHSSIEGTYQDNEELSRSRVRAFASYLDYSYGLSRRFPVDVSWVGEDWSALRELVAASELPEREEILEIIDRVDIFKGREALLMKLNGGKPYRRMKEEFFPLLRRVSITVEYEHQQPAESKHEDKPAVPHSPQVDRIADATPLTDQAGITAIADDAPSQQETTSVLVGTPWVQCVLYPVFSLKTNVIAWAGITPELRITTIVPNFSGEYFFSRRWSLEAGAAYTNRHYDGGRQFEGLSIYYVEPRLWLTRYNLHRWFYTGAYFRSGDYNIRRIREEGTGDASTTNYTGVYWQAGLSAGCYVILSRHWGVEFGLRGGYQRSKASVYDIEGSKYYLDYYTPKSGLMLTDLILSITYRWGK